MECSHCGKSIRNGYFNESEEGMTYICIDCLLRFDSFRKRRKYDYASIYKMHEQGYCDRTIATQFGTNPLTISGIIKDIERTL
jgi:DNA-directed RNA polymerase subunit RPC12/RpoP